MSMEFKKTGVVRVDGDIIEENILLDTLKDAGKSHTTYNLVDYNFSESVVNGNKYTIIAKVITSSEKHGVCFYHSGGSYQMGAWQPISDNEIYKITFTANSNMASQTSGGGHGYCRVYVSNNDATVQGSTTVTGTGNVEWIKIVKGESVTAWTPNPSDELYTSNTQGAIETNQNNTRFFNGHIEVEEFIEW